MDHQHRQIRLQGDTATKGLPMNRVAIKDHDQRQTIAERNRTNSLLSTGPKTEEGKLIAARNSMLSTGPRTLEGKQVVRLNAVSHGLDSKDIVIANLGETDDQWERFLAGVADHWQPQDDYECELVVQIAEILWRLKRVRRYRMAAIDKIHDEADKMSHQAMQRGDMDAHPDKIKRLAQLPDNKRMDKADRHEAHLLRSLKTVTHELRLTRMDDAMGTRTAFAAYIREIRVVGKTK